MSLMASKELGWQNAWIMAKSIPDEEVGERVTRLWKAAGYKNSKAFAKELKVSPQRLNNIENGKPLSRDMANKMRQVVPGLSTEWLWYGVTDGLSVALARSLGELDTKVG